MRTVLEKTVHHAGVIHRQDISDELLNRTTVVTLEPVHTQAVLKKHAATKAQSLIQQK